MSAMVCVKNGPINFGGDSIGVGAIEQGIGCEEWKPLSEALASDLGGLGEMGLSSTDLAQIAVITFGGLLSVFVAALGVAVIAGMIRRSSQTP